MSTRRDFPLGLDATIPVEELRPLYREPGFIGGSLPLNAFATLEGARSARRSSRLRRNTAVIFSFIAGRPMRRSRASRHPMRRAIRTSRAGRLGPYSRIGDWVRIGIDRIGADRILFGTDYG